MHCQVLADRLLAAAGVGRLGSRIRGRIEAHLDALSAAGALRREGDFVARRRQLLAPRLRSWRAAPDKTRELDHVHDSALMLCLLRAVLEEDADAGTAMNNGLHRIGCIRLTSRARARLEAPLQALIDAAMLAGTREHLTLGPNACLRRGAFPHRGV